MWNLTRCGAVAPLLWDYAADKLLDAKERARVEAHVSRCERCRADVAAFREMAGAWDAFAMSPPAAPPGRWEALHTRLVAQAGASAPVRRRPVIAATAIAGAFFAGVVGMAALLLPTRTSPERIETATVGGTPSEDAAGSSARTVGVFRNRRVTLNVEPAFPLGSVGALGRGPCPLVVTIKNEGPAFEGEIITRPADRPERRYVRRVDVGADRTERFFVYPRLPGWQYSHDVNVSLSGPFRTMETTAPRVTGAGNGGGSEIAYIGYGMGLLRPSRATYPGSHVDAGPTSRAASVLYNDSYSPPENAPDRVIGYDGIDVLVLGKGSERLDERQWGAIREWVLSGGSLILLGGKEAHALRTPQGAELAPVDISDHAPATGVLSARLSGLGWLSPTARDSSEVTWGLLKSGSVGLDEMTPAIMAPGALVGMARRPFGLGTVLYVGYDPTAPAFRDWSELPTFWQHLILKSDPLLSPKMSFLSARQLSFEELPQGTESRGANDPFGISLPPVSAVLYLFLAYFVLAIPVTFVVLKRLRCMNLAWATGPALAVLFAGAFFLFTAELYTARLSRRTIGLVFAGEGRSQGRFMGNTELFFPHAGTYDVTVPAAEQMEVGDSGYYSSTDARAMAMRSLETEDDGGSVRTPALNVTNLAFRRLFHSQRVTLGPGGITADLRWDANGHLIGTVANGTTHTIRRACVAAPNVIRTSRGVFTGSKLYVLGDLPPGETTVDVASGYTDPPGGSRKEVAMRFGGATFNAEGTASLYYPVLSGRLSGEGFGPSIGQWVGGDESVLILVRLNGALKGGPR